MVFTILDLIHRRSCPQSYKKEFKIVVCYLYTVRTNVENQRNMFRQGETYYNIEILDYTLFLKLVKTSSKLSFRIPRSKSKYPKPKANQLNK